MRYKPNREGLRQVLASAEAASLVSAHAEAIAAKCGDGFTASQQLGKVRQRAIVYADTWSARHRERRENVMVRALG